MSGNTTGNYSEVSVRTSNEKPAKFGNVFQGGPGMVLVSGGCREQISLLSITRHKAGMDLTIIKTTNVYGVAPLLSRKWHDTLPLEHRPAQAVRHACGHIAVIGFGHTPLGLIIL
jgi:hypothetical protein